MNHYGCDRCGRVTTKEEMTGRRGLMPNEWESVRLTNVGQTSLSERLDFCGGCVVHLKLGDKMRLIESESVAERLVELLEELAQGVVESQ